MPGVCHIFGAMVADGAPKSPEGLIIAADAGWNVAVQHGITPHIAVGDFDSLGSIPKADEIIKHPIKKDDTDMMLAVKTGFERGCDRFYLYGGIGGNIDHTLANIQTLAFIASRGARGYLVSKNETITVINNSAIKLSAGKGRISVFALTECEGVFIKGLLYPLDNARLSPEFPLGVSNSFADLIAEISVGNGTLAIVYEGSPDLILEER